MTVTLICEVCGEEFEAGRCDAKYCSNKCKMKKRNRRNWRKLWPPAPAPKPAAPAQPPAAPAPEVSEAEVAEVQAAVLLASKAANDLGRLSRSGPYQMRAACSRISAAISTALKSEGL